MAKPILIAEDYADDVLMLEIALRQAGIANPTRAVRDGEETMAYFAGQGAYANRNKFPLPGALFLDLRLPRRNGFEVLQWLRSRAEFNDLLIVILTGARETRFVQHAYQLGANSFIVKPCQPSNIYTLILYFGKYWALSDSNSETPTVEAGEGLVLEPALAFGGVEENEGEAGEFAGLEDDLVCVANTIA
jgi:CheY-like chemotaxis protein